MDNQASIGDNHEIIVFLCDLIFYLLPLKIQGLLALVNLFFHLSGCFADLPFNESYRSNQCIQNLSLKNLTKTTFFSLRIQQNLEIFLTWTGFLY